MQSLLETGHDIQQRRLARTGRTQNGGQIAGMKGAADTTQDDFVA